MHVGGIALLILVVLLSVIWTSAQHNKLAKDLVGGPGPRRHRFDAARA